MRTGHLAGLVHSLVVERLHRWPESIAVAPVAVE